jgi:hypothetical protein
MSEGFRCQVSGEWLEKPKLLKLATGNIRDINKRASCGDLNVGDPIPDEL